MSAALPPLLVTKRRPRFSVRVLKLVRQVHLYLGVFCAPALLFFAVTGMLQTFGLHQNSRASGYKAPQWIAMAGQIHKNQTYVLRKPTVPASVQAAPKPVPPPATARSLQVAREHTLPEKIFFLIVGWSFVFSVLTGVSMAYKYDRNVWLVSGLLVAGLVVPVVLLFV